MTCPEGEVPANGKWSAVCEIVGGHNQWTTHITKCVNPDDILAVLSEPSGSKNSNKGGGGKEVVKDPSKESTKKKKDKGSKKADKAAKKAAKANKKKNKKSKKSGKKDKKAKKRALRGLI